MKKFIAIVLVLVTVLSLCACGKPAGYTDSDKDGYLTAEGKTKLTIGLIPDAMIMDLDNNALTNWIEEECNVELEFMPFAGGTDVPTQIAAAIAARQELPDLCLGINLGSSTLKRYGDEGYIIDLQDYFADKEGASKIFWDRVNNELTERERDRVISVMTDSDSTAIYALPSIETSLADKIRSMAWINQEWLDKLGLKAPTNTDELVEVLKAFKTKDPNGNGIADEIPLYGSANGFCSDVVSWLLNMFTYWDKSATHNMTEDGDFFMAYTTDGYRKGLQFVHKLYEEGLLTSLVFSPEERTILTPTNGTALCGIFLAHLTSCQRDNDLMYDYEPLQTWGYGVRDKLSINPCNFMTDSCAEGKRDKAFEVLMTLWSWEGSQRQRYGEYGVNWTDADEGAKSAYGLDATYKLLNDVLGTQNTVTWRTMCSFNNMAECETAQIDEMQQFEKDRAMKHAQAYEQLVKAEATVPEYLIAPALPSTTEESEAVVMESTNVYDYWTKSQADFITGQNGMDIDSDASWQAYLNKLNELGVEKLIQSYRDRYQRLYGNKG